MEMILMGIGLSNVCNVSLDWERLLFYYEILEVYPEMEVNNKYELECVISALQLELSRE